MQGMQEKSRKSPQPQCLDVWAACAQAGLLIAETEFALQVESDIAPYKGLLMGLFFMTVGMEISVGLFFAKIRTVIAGILGLLIGKVRFLNFQGEIPNETEALVFLLPLWGCPLHLKPGCTTY
jgi:hypothetical protein